MHTLLKQNRICSIHQPHGRADKVLSREDEATEVHHQQAIITGNVQGTNLRKKDQNHDH